MLTSDTVSSGPHNRLAPIHKHADLASITRIEFLKTIYRISIHELRYAVLMKVF
jgi:hypothetical protein